MSSHHWKSEKQDKIDFGKLSVEEQKRISKAMMDEESEKKAVNETIAAEARKKLDEFRSHHIQ
jgi:hypothetical protein